MILGRDVHLHAACFDEINGAVDRLLIAANDPRIVVFNAHAFPDRVPPDAIVYNLENIDVQVRGDAFPAHEVWDFSARNATRWRGPRRAVRHVPPGYHSSMERFLPLPWNERDIDVVFTGCMNARRQHVLDALARHGLKTLTLSTAYVPIATRSWRARRSRSTCSTTRTAPSPSCVPRTTPRTPSPPSRRSRTKPPYGYIQRRLPYTRLVDSCRELLEGGEEKLVGIAAEALRRFREHPLRRCEADTLSRTEIFNVCS